MSGSQPTNPLDGLVPFTTGFLVSATQAHPGSYPDAFKAVGRNPRSASRNTLLGTIVSNPEPSNPEPSVIVFGINYIDAHDVAKTGHGHNQDMFVYEGGTLTPFKPAAFRARFPQYGDPHWADQTDVFEL